MFGKRKNKSTKDKKNSESRLGSFVLAIGTVLAALIITYGPSLNNSPCPKFGPKLTYLNRYEPIIIVAKNGTAEKVNVALDVKWDGYGISKGAVPQFNKDGIKWNLSIDKAFIPEQCKHDGEHTLQIGLNGDYSEPEKIVFDSIAPIDKGTAKLDGKKILNLEVALQPSGYFKLEWNDLPEEIKETNSLTIVYRNSEAIKAVDGNIYIDKDAADINKSPIFQIAKRGRGGRYYKSAEKKTNLPKRTPKSLNAKGFPSNLEISAPEEFCFDSTWESPDLPKSLCVTEDDLFLVPDSFAGTVGIFGKNSNTLSYITELSSNSSDDKRVVKPVYCLYNRQKAQFGVIDYSVDKIFIYDRPGTTDFKLSQTFPCPYQGYDIAFSSDNTQLIVAGYIIDKKDNPFDLYSIDLRNGELEYLLPAFKKYDLKSNDEYFYEYNEKNTIPAVGIKAFIDIHEDNLFFVWEGAFRIIKVDIPSKKSFPPFGKTIQSYIKPDTERLAYLYRNRLYDTLWKDRKKMTYIRNIFVTPRHVFLIYEIGKIENLMVPSFRMQVYTPDGIFLQDILIPGSPGSAMWFDKCNYELYAFSKAHEGSHQVSVLKYQISSSICREKVAMR